MAAVRLSLLYYSIVLNKFFMKTTVNGKQQPSHPQVKTPKRPENKDNLDSREGEEQLFKGDDTTHNKKEKHGAPKQRKK